MSHRPRVPRAASANRERVRLLSSALSPLTPDDDSVPAPSSLQVAAPRPPTHPPAAKPARPHKAARRPGPPRWRKKNRQEPAAAAPPAVASQKAAPVASSRKAATRPPKKLPPKKAPTPQAAKPKKAPRRRPQEPVPAHTFSGRLVVLAVVLVASAGILTPTVSDYLRQQQQLADARSALQAAQEQQDSLRKDIARSDDSLYIAKQARDKFDFVAPGDTSYRISGAEDGHTPDGEHQPGQMPPASPAGSPQGWAETLWDSIKRAAQS